MASQSSGSGSQKSKKSRSPSFDRASPSKKVRTESTGGSQTSTKVKKEKKKSSALASPTSGSNPASLVFGWERSDIRQLIDNVSAAMVGRKDTGKYTTTMARLDWDNIAFGDHDGGECRKKFEQILDQRMRKYRTLGEILVDAREFAKQPWLTFGINKTTKLPGMPKKPLTPFFRFFTERREEYKGKHPELSVTEISSQLSQKYNELSDKKKAKYKKAYDDEMAEYERARNEWIDANPEYKAQLEMTKNKPPEGPSKPLSPQQLFIQEKLKEKEHTKDNIDALKKKFDGLKENKRVKWIKKAVADEKRYLADLAAYQAENPNFKPPAFKSVLTKADRQLKDRIEGKPEKPPSSGYQLFSKMMLKKIPDVDSKQKLSVIAERWRQLEAVKIAQYNEEAKELNDKYREEVDNYIASLPEEEREAALKELRPAPVQRPMTKAQKEKAEKIPLDKLNAHPEILKKATELFTMDRLSELEAKNIKLTPTSMIEVTNEWDRKSLEEKSKYLRQAQEQLHISNIGTPRGKKSSRKVVLHLHPDLMAKLPKAPPRGAYALFSAEQLSKLTNIEPTKRMAEISKRWQKVNEKDRQKLAKRSIDMYATFDKECQSFRKQLSGSDLEEFDAWAKSHGLAKNGKPKAEKKPKKPVVNHAEEESESSEDESEEEEPVSPAKKFIGKPNAKSNSKTQQKKQASSSEESSDEDDSD